VRLSKPLKILIGFFTGIPTACLLFSLVLFGWEFLAAPAQNVIATNLAGWVILLLVMFAVAELLLLGLAAFYVAYIVKTRRLRPKRKWFWGALVVGAGTIAMPIFFMRYVWPSREAFLSRANRRARSRR